MTKISDFFFLFCKKKTINLKEKFQIFFYKKKTIDLKEKVLDLFL